MVVITARARIHRSDQHKAGRIIDRETGTRNRDLAILQRLTHHFEHTSVELRQLIEKQYPIMSQTDLSRLRISSPAYHRHIRNGMMRRTERTLYHQGSLHPYLSCYRMDLRCLQRFMQGERRKNSRQPFCQHRLAASRCTYHQQVMTTGSSRVHRRNRTQTAPGGHKILPSCSRQSAAVHAFHS